MPPLLSRRCGETWRHQRPSALEPRVGDVGAIVVPDRNVNSPRLPSNRTGAGMTVFLISCMACPLPWTHTGERWSGQHSAAIDRGTQKDNAATPLHNF